MANSVWVAAVAAATVYFGSIGEADNDLWMHLFVGRWIWERQAVPRLDEFSYTAAGSPWVDHEWLWQVLAFLSFHLGGTRILFLLKLVLVALSVIYSWRSLFALEGQNRAASAFRDVPAQWLAGIVLLLTIPVLARGWAMRPQLATYVLLPALLVVLAQWERGSGRRWAVLVWSFALWANVHGGFLLGLLALAFFAGAGLVQGKKEFATRCALLLLCLAASWCNPYGPRLYVYLWDELGRPHPITEWQPVSLETEHAAFVFLGLLFVATLWWLPRERAFVWRALFACGALWFAWRHQRHTPVFALLAAPLLYAQLQGVLATLRRRSWVLSLPARRALIVGVACIAALQSSLAVAGFYRHGGRFVFDSREYPVGAVQSLRSGKARGNLAVPLDWGGYVLWHLAPEIKPSLDGRFATVYPASVVKDNFTFFRGEPGWRNLIQLYPTEAVLLPARVVHPLQREPGWVRVYADGTAALYVRSDRVDAFPTAEATSEVRTWMWFP